MAKQKITHHPTYKGMVIQTDSQRGLGCIENILGGMHERLTYMTNKHKQVSVVELVVTLPKSVSPENATQVVADAIRSVRKTMSNQKKETQTCWTREMATIADHDRPHYNVAFITDGSKCQSGMGIKDHLQRLIAKRSSDPVNDPGNVHCCKYENDYQDLHPIEKASAMKIRQDKPGADKQFENVFNRFSYDAKISQKGNAAPGQREFGFSQLPRINKRADNSSLRIDQV